MAAIANSPAALDAVRPHNRLLLACPHLGPFIPPEQIGEHQAKIIDAFGSAS